MWLKPHSFRFGVLFTLVVSLANEYYFDRIENGEEWIFSEQVIHTRMDISGLILACIVYKKVFKKI